jgi:hypothetical protein
LIDIFFIVGINRQDNKVKNLIIINKTQSKEK